MGSIEFRTAINKSICTDFVILLRVKMKLLGNIIIDLSPIKIYNCECINRKKTDLSILILGYFPLTLLLFTLFWFETPLLAQETSFKTNGPDDFRESHYAFTHATVYKDFQTILPNATVVIKNGKIVDINTSGTFPVGAVVRDLKGKFIYPSFIDIFSDYGMPKVKKGTKEEGVQYESNI
jgi:hypothetical protein